MKVIIPKRNERGNGLLITMILILVMMVIIVGSLSIASLQSDISNIDKEASNTYTLARSAAEKAVDNMNKEIEIATYDIMEQVRIQTLDKVKDDLSTIKSNKDYNLGTFKKFDYVNHKEGQAPSPRAGAFGDSTNQILYSRGEDLRELVLKELQKKILGNEDGNPKKITYDVNSDYTYDVKNQANPGSVTKVTVTISKGSTDEEYIIDAVSQVVDSTGSVVENLEGVQAKVVIDIASRIDAYLNERYKWFDDNNPAEILSGAIISYSPITIKQGTLNVVGDMKVTGNPLRKFRLTDEDKRRIEDGYDLTFELPKAYKGVFVTGGVLDVEGNLYCASNVASAGGIINVDEDVVADTIGIFDRFYPDYAPADPTEVSLEPWRNLVTGHITIGKNAYVDNDVMIERYTKDSTITVGGSIFGVMDGDKGETIQHGGIDVVDPNRSSGIFNRGQGSSTITAGRIYVHGQPYITFNDGNGYHALFESVGEPYEEDLYRLPEYSGMRFGETEEYLHNEPYASSIKKDKIQVTNLSSAFAPQYITVNGNPPEKIDVASLLLNPADAKNFFYRGMAGYPGAVASDISPYAELWNDFTGYYLGDTVFKGKKDFYAKEMAPFGTEDADGLQYFGGIKAIMTAKRAPLYGQFQDNEFPVLKFHEATNLDYLKVIDWSVANPVKVINSGTININEFAVDGEAYPTVIVSKGNLTLYTSGITTFKGIIVSAGQVTVAQSMDIEGTMVLGSGIDLADSSVTLKVTHNPNIIFEPNYADKELFRYILDALSITNFMNSGGSAAAALNATQPENLTYRYTMPRVMLTEDMHLTVETQNIVAKIKEIKKIEY